MSRPIDDVRDTLVLVTGAGSGIGRATAERFARHGAKVLATDLDEGTAAETATRCRAIARRDSPGATSTSYCLDVADRAAVDALAARVADEHGTLDVLVNNAGVGMSGRFLDMEAEDWEWIVGINLMGVVHGCAAFGPAMVDRGRGQVVNVSSGLGYTPRATEPGYVTTKAAVLALSQCLRADWARHGVGVSVVCPGVIATPIISSTRLRGERAGAPTADRLTRAFSRGHRPGLVASAIVSAVVRNRPVVPVGIEAWAGWVANGLLPQRAVEQLARLSPGGL